MNAQDILAELKPLGSASYKKVLFNHGIQEPIFGVRSVTADLGDNAWKSLPLPIVSKNFEIEAP